MEPLSPLTRRALFGGGIAAAGCGLPPFAAVAPSAEAPFDVRRFGAKGDGKADDTAAAQAAIDAALRSRAGRVHFPSGEYRITKSLRIGSAERIDITGDGWSTQLLHERDEHLFLWPAGISCRECSVRHLRVVSAVEDKGRGTAAIACLGGVERSFFSHLLFSRGKRFGSGIVTESVADTTSIDHCVMWEISGTGVRLARGSEIRIFGGRITGDGSFHPANVGVLLTTDNGGVHIVTTDLILLHTGLQIGEAGRKANREIFVTHATFDSSKHGLRQLDHASTSLAGFWAASSDEYQILIEESAVVAIVSFSGGTIFNGGAYRRPGSHHGIVVKAGRFTLSGVHVRHNLGTGIWAGPGARDYAITGCRVHDNGLGMRMEGRRGAITGNVFTANGKDARMTLDAERQTMANVWRV